jgi:hypothetical protein
VSKDELTRLLDNQRTYMNGKFDELMRTINSLVTRVEHVEQRPPPQRPRQVPPEDGEDEEYDDDDADARNEDRL